MEQPRLTVIIPVKDRPEELRQAVQSLQLQEPLPDAVIIVDDGSETPVDVSLPTRQRLNLTVIRHSKSRGAAAARNTGMQACETEWLTFLDSDDALIEGSLPERWQFVLKDQGRRPPPEQTIYGCGWLDVDAAGQVLGARMPRPADGVLDFATGCWFSPGTCVILNREAALKVGLQDETLRRLEDYDWFLRLGLAGFVYRCQPTYGARIMRVRRQSPTVIAATGRQLLSKWQTCGFPGIRRRMQAYIELEIAAANFFAGKRLAAAAHIVRSCAAYPRFGLNLSPGWQTRDGLRPEAATRS